MVDSLISGGLAPSDERVIGAGSCRLQISVAVSFLKLTTSIETPKCGLLYTPTDTYRWKILIEGEPVWESDTSDELIMTKAGIAVGTAFVSVGKIFRTLKKLDISVDEIVAYLDAQEDGTADLDTSGVKQIYKQWQLEVYTSWGADPLTFPIDMGVTDGGRP